MQSYLRQLSVTIESLGGEGFLITELSAAGQADIMDAIAAEKTPLQIAAIAASHCVVDWKDETPETIAANVGYAALTEIGQAIQELSGVETDPKGSKDDRAAA